MQIDLDGQVIKLIQQQIERGDYQDANDVVRDAVLMMNEREERLNRLRAELAIGLEQIERGEMIDLTPELLDEIATEAEANMRDGKPVRDAVKP
jgi:antitoxin ParD1/3/4